MIMHSERQASPQGVIASCEPVDRPSTTAQIGVLAPGFLLCVAVALVALALQRLPGMSHFSSLGIAMLLGIALGNIRSAGQVLKPGIDFATKRVLRFAVVLLGFQVTWSAIAGLGWAVLASTSAILALTFVVTRWVGVRIGVDRGLSELIAAGTAVCGATAVVSTNTVTRAPDEIAAYAVASVTLFGTIAIFLYPHLAARFGLDATTFGLWMGMSVHEVAQVTAAAYSGGNTALEAAILAKFARVLLLGPLVLALCVLTVDRLSPGAEAKPKVAMPWFIVFFAMVVAANSAIAMPEELRSSASTAAAFLLTTALAAIGMETSLAKFRKLGPSPLLLGAFSSAFIAIASLLTLIILG